MAIVYPNTTRIQILESGAQLGIKVDNQVNYYDRSSLLVSSNRSAIITISQKTLSEETENIIILQAYTQSFIDYNDKSVKNIVDSIKSLINTIPVLELTEEELAAIQGANEPSADNVFVTEKDLIYGSNLQTYYDPTPSTTTSTTFQSKISELTPELEAGDYEIEISYGWNHNATNSDFEGRLTFDGTILGDPFGNGVTHKQEPADSGGTGGGSGTSQQHSFFQKFPVTIATEGQKQVDLDYRTDTGGDESTIWDAYIKIKRIR